MNASPNAPQPAHRGPRVYRWLVRVLPPEAAPDVRRRDRSAVRPAARQGAVAAGAAAGLDARQTGDAKRASPVLPPVISAPQGVVGHRIGSY
jgi:hypothetical protein